MITKYTQYIKENTSNSQFFKTYDKTKLILDYLGIKYYTINPDLTVDVDGSVYLIHKGLDYIPVKFGKVVGNFNCSGNNLTSLIGSPEEVGNNFNCSNNNLTNLIGSPKKVVSGFICIENPLTSLDGLSISIFKDNIKSYWFNHFSSKIKEEYFDKMLEDNPEIISLIDFETSPIFKKKWNHLFNANKFDLI